MLKGGALDVAKDMLRGGPRFTARARFGSTVVIDNMQFAVRRGTSDIEVVRQIWRDGQYAFPYAALTDRLHRFATAIRARGRTPVIVDAGANIGAASLWFAREWPAARIVAVEPDAANAGMARQNCRNAPNIDIVEAAIGSAPGFARLGEEADAYAITTARADHGVPVVTIADCVARVPNGNLFAVKIDIEGFEDDLFAANTGWLDEAKLVYIEPHDHLLPDRGSSKTFQAEMGRRKFDLLIRGENLVYVRREEHEI